MGHHHGHHHHHHHHHRNQAEKPFKPSDAEREMRRAMQAHMAHRTHPSHPRTSTGNGGASDMGPGIAMIGLLFVVVVGGLAVSAIGWASAIMLGVVGGIAAVVIGAVVAVTVRSARAREAAEAAAERDDAQRMAAIAASAPTLVTLLLEIPSSSRAEVARFAAGTSAYVTLTELVEALRGQVGSASLRSAAPGADVAPTDAVHAALDALATRDVRSAEAGYRDGAPTHSIAAPGSVVVAAVVAVRGAGPLTPVHSVDTIRASLESLFPIESQTAAFALRVIPEAERALPLDAVRALFPELVPLMADGPDPRTLPPR